MSREREELGALRQIKSFAEEVDHSISQLIQLLQDPRYSPDWSAFSSVVHAAAFFSFSSRAPISFSPFRLLLVLSQSGKLVCVNLMCYRIKFNASINNFTAQVSHRSFSYCCTPFLLLCSFSLDRDILSSFVVEPQSVRCEPTTMLGTNVIPSLEKKWETQSKAWTGTVPSASAATPPPFSFSAASAGAVGSPSLPPTEPAALAAQVRPRVHHSHFSR